MTVTFEICSCCLSLQHGKRNRNPVFSGECERQVLVSFFLCESSGSAATQAIHKLHKEKFNVPIDASHKDLHNFTKHVVAFTDLKQIASTKGLGQNPGGHKPTLVGRPIISGCDGPTERISCFVDRLIQPIAQQQESYLKDSTDFINFIEKTKLPKKAILASMDVTSLYTNIPQEEGITTVCKAYEDFYQNHLPIPTKFLRQMLCLILKENSFNSMGDIICKPTERQWEPKWPWLLLMFSWQK